MSILLNKIKVKSSIEHHNYERLKRLINLLESLSCQYYDGFSHSVCCCLPYTHQCSRRSPCGQETGDVSMVIQ